MKHIPLLPIAIGTVVCFTASYSQNIAINTSGTPAASTNMLEVTQSSTAANMVAIYAIHSGASAGTGYGLYATKTGAATTNIGGFFNASGGTNNYGIIVPSGGGFVGIGTSTPTRWLQVEGSGAGLHTAAFLNTTGYGLAMGSTTGSAFGSIQAFNSGTGTTAPLILQYALGGSVGIGNASPGATLDVTGNVKTTGSALSPGVWVEGDYTAAAGTSYGLLSRGTLTAAANNDRLISLASNIGVAAPGAFTGVNFYGAEIDAGSWTKSGGTISNAFGLRVMAPTIGTNNYSASFTGGYVGIGTTAPIWPLDVTYTINTATWNARGAYIQPTLTGSGDGPGGLSSQPIVTPSANITTAYGLIGVCVANPPAGITINNVNPGHFRFDTKAGSAGAVTSANVIQVSAPSIGGIVPTNIFGINIANQGVAGITNAYGLYVAPQTGANNNYAGIFLGGNVGIGTATPSEKLTVTGGSVVGQGLLETAYNAPQSAANAEYLTYNFASNNWAGIGGYTNGAMWFRGQDMVFWTPGTGVNPPTNVMVFNQAGRLGVGTTGPGGQFEITLDQGRKPSTNTWTIVSDERLKNIDGTYTKGLKEVLQLLPITYHYKNVGERKFPEEVIKTQNVGFNAQDVQKIFPEAVGTDADGYLNFNIHVILVAYANAFKEQQSQIEELTKKVNSLENSMKASGSPASAEKK